MRVTTTAAPTEGPVNKVRILRRELPNANSIPAGKWDVILNALAAKLSFDEIRTLVQNIKEG